MSSTVTLPLWLFLLIIAFAAVAFFWHFLFPSVRWFFRRRMERLVRRLNTRLDRPIEPFKLMERHDTIERLAHDPKVALAVAEEAAANGEPEAVVLERVRRYAREIVPSFSATVYFTVGARLARWTSRMLYNVKLIEHRLSGIDPKATVVFIINHRSNMDYVLITYIAAQRSALSYAVGEWARVWPLSGLVRMMGAYFIRRKADRPLYRRVLSRYVQMATAEGVTQAIFPEGGLSLDGRTAAPKLGLLSYIMQGERPVGRDVVFIPVSLNYDRLIEDRVLIAAHASGVRRFRAPFLSIVAFVLRHVWRAIVARFRRFGDAVVCFGDPVSLSAFVAGRSGDVTAELAAELMARVTRHVPVLSVPLITAAWGTESAVARGALLGRAGVLLQRLREAGAEIALPEGGVEAALDAAMAIFRVRGLVRVDGDRLVLVEGQRPLFDFYAASVLQLLDADAE